MIRCLSYLNTMSDIVYKKTKLVHTITFDIILFNQQKKKRQGLACENSRPSSLPAEWRFARRNATRPGAKKDGCFRRLSRGSFSDNYY